MVLDNTTKISVLGCGRWGSFLGWYLNTLGFRVAIYGRKDSANYNALKDTRKNSYVTLPESVELTSELNEAVNRADVIIISISSQALRSFIRSIREIGFSQKTFVLCMKGIECDTGKRLSEVLIEEGVDSDRVAVWVGPGHIQEFTTGKPNCMVIDSNCPELTKKLADGFRSNLIRFYYGEDLIGSEIGAAAKNVLGIAAGMLDGGGYTTLKGPLMTRGAMEVARLIGAMGGNSLSAYGLCHLGDYETTLFSEFSNNRRFGEAYAKGKTFDKLCEGVSTAKAMKMLGEKYNVELPITNALCNILFEGGDTFDELLRLFSRSMRSEFNF